MVYKEKEDGERFSIRGLTGEQLDRIFKVINNEDLEDIDNKENRRKRIREIRKYLPRGKGIKDVLENDLNELRKIYPALAEDLLYEEKSRFSIRLLEKSLTFINEEKEKKFIYDILSKAYENVADKLENEKLKKEAYGKSIVYLNKVKELYEPRAFIIKLQLLAEKADPEIFKRFRNN